MSSVPRACPAPASHHSSEDRSREGECVQLQPCTHVQRQGWWLVTLTDSGGLETGGCAPEVKRSRHQAAGRVGHRRPQ